MRLHITLTMTVLLASGCSSLRIEVGVLNPEVVSETAKRDRIEKVVPEIVSEDDAQIDARFSAVHNDHYAAYARFAAILRADMQKLPENDPERELIEASASSHDRLSDFTEKSYADAKKSIKANTHAIRTLWPQYMAGGPDQLAIQRQLSLQLDEREFILEKFAQMVQADIRDLGEDESISESARMRIVSYIQQQAFPATARSLTKLMDSGGLEHSPYAHLVANAPDNKWASKFDDTVAKGTFGNTDVAIKALGPTNFTIKGLSFNPADVAAMASKVTTQAVLLASQIAGVPVKPSTPPASSHSGGALAQSSSGVSSTLAATIQADEAVRAQRDSLARIAAAILREKQSIEGTDSARRREALDVIIAVYESSSPNLRIAQPSQGE